jgi:hypothetical protein
MPAVSTTGVVSGDVSTAGVVSGDGFSGAVSTAGVVSGDGFSGDVSTAAGFSGVGPAAADVSGVGTSACARALPATIVNRASGNAMLNVVFIREIKRRGVNAIAPTCFRWPIVKDVPQVSVALGAAHFGTELPIASVFEKPEVVVAHVVGKTWPPAARLELLV